METFILKSKDFMFKMASRANDIIEYEHPDLNEYEEFLSYLERSEYIKNHIIFTLPVKAGHPWEERIPGPACIAANGQKGRILSLKVGRRYFFTFNPNPVSSVISSISVPSDDKTSHSIYFTLDPIGGPDGKALEGLPDPIDTFRTVSFVVQEEFPPIFFYQDRSNPCMGGMIVVEDTSPARTSSRPNRGDMRSRTRPKEEGRTRPKEEGSRTRPKEEGSRTRPNEDGTRTRPKEEGTRTRPKEGRARPSSNHQSGRSRSEKPSRSRNPRRAHSSEISSDSELNRNDPDFEVKPPRVREFDNDERRSSHPKPSHRHHHEEERQPSHRHHHEEERQPSHRHRDEPSNRHHRHHRPTRYEDEPEGPYGDDDWNQERIHRDRRSSKVNPTDCYGVLPADQH